MLWLLQAVGNNWGKQQATSKSLKVKSRAGDVYKGFENLNCFYQHPQGKDFSHWTSSKSNQWGQPCNRGFREPPDRSHDGGSMGMRLSRSPDPGLPLLLSARRLFSAVIVVGDFQGYHGARERGVEIRQVKLPQISLSLLSFGHFSWLKLPRLLKSSG